MGLSFEFWVFDKNYGLCFVAEESGVGETSNDGDDEKKTKLV